MLNPNLPALLWAQLEGRLWHSTGIPGLKGILEEGIIGSTNARKYPNSFSHSRSAVSLFDFGPDSSDQDDLMRSNWHPWLGPEHEGRCAIWLEIDRLRSSNKLMSPKAISEASKTETPKRRFFVGVEACHLGPIPIGQIVGALFIDKHDLSLFRRADGPAFDLPKQLDSFCAGLPEPPPEHPLVQAIRLSQKKK